MLFLRGLQTPDAMVGVLQLLNEFFFRLVVQDFWTCRLDKFVASVILAHMCDMCEG